MAWILCLLCAGAHAAGAPAIDAEGIGWAVRHEIRAGNLPGAVILVGDRRHILYRKAFGARATQPRREPMTMDTVFDLASLTKVVATTTAVMQLVRQGRVDLDAPAARYWPAFAAEDKSGVTVRQLLTHTSGLAADLDLSVAWTGADETLRRLAAQPLIAAPGARYLYSDLNFMVLGEIVQRVSGQPLDEYCRRHVFVPLGMNLTRFRPPAAWRSRIAPTVFDAGRMLRGVVHDPSARRMDGVAGNAGLFSTADDLARFARMLLAGGAVPGREDTRPVLDADAVRLMSDPEPVAAARDRGLGWDVGAPLVANRDALAPGGFISHTGYTGTLLAVDLQRGLYVVILSNRVHPRGGGDAQPLRRAVLALLAAAGPPAAPAPLQAGAPDGVETGIDVLARQDFAPLRGLKVGLITNQTGVSRSGARTADLLHQAAGVQLLALFSPEHGLSGQAEGKVGDTVDEATGLPVHSLYGVVRRPTAAMLQGLDALVFDIQDSGTRFFTYISTMGYAMEAAAKQGLKFFVLDRPDPIRADVVEGPMLDADATSFTGYFPLPLRPGMTVGELAQLFNAQAGIRADLTVVPLQGYRRDAWYGDTGLPWIPPSPNLRTPTEALLYPGVGLAEGANVSVGRGTATPFEVVGAPWIDARRLAAYLDGRDIPGVIFVPVRFTPAADPYAAQRCGGVRILLTGRERFSAGRLGIELASALQRLYPRRFRLDGIAGLLGSKAALAAIAAGTDPRAIVEAGQADVTAFAARRQRYLLYPRQTAASETVAEHTYGVAPAGVRH